MCEGQDPGRGQEGMGVETSEKDRERKRKRGGGERERSVLMNSSSFSCTIRTKRTHWVWNRAKRWVVE
jgi:hypothetical protein